MSQSDKIEEGTFVVSIPICFCLLYHANRIMFFCVHPTSLAVKQSKVTNDSLSTKVMSEEDAAVSALDATASVNAVAEDDVKVKVVDADNEPENLGSICDSYVVAMSSDVRKIRGRGRRKVISGSTPVRVGSTSHKEDTNKSP